MIFKVKDIPHGGILGIKGATLSSVHNNEECRQLSNNMDCDLITEENK